MEGDAPLSSGEVDSRITSNALTPPVATTGVLLVLDQRAIFREGLRLWLSALDPEFLVEEVADAEVMSTGSLLARAGMAILTSAANPFDDPWLREQVEWLLAARADLPIVLIGDVRYAAAADTATGHWRLSGYIPETSGKELVAAALRLILAGGSYFPRRSPADANSPVAVNGHRAVPPQAQARLSPRERAVLALLEHGLPNKVIGHRLGMSQSTVKAHVHSIISKLNVRNRTEAAVARFEHLAPKASPPLAPNRTAGHAAILTELERSLRRQHDG
jgi:DNA-binding NarL/FixJ family response regulator